MRSTIRTIHTHTMSLSCPKLPSGLKNLELHEGAGHEIPGVRLKTIRFFHANDHGLHEHAPTNAQHQLEKLMKVAQVGVKIVK